MSHVNFIVHDPAGKIVRAGMCGDDTVALQTCGDDSLCVLITEKYHSPDLFCVKDGAIEELTSSA
jgi:hypothetical protein